MVIGHVRNVKYVFQIMSLEFFNMNFSKITQSSFNITNHSTNEFHTMLKYALRRMKSHPQVRFLKNL